MNYRIPFNRPFLTGKETDYIREAVYSGKISGNGEFTQRCQDFFEERYGFTKCLLTTSCTDALEMAAILAGIGPGDEVIMPSYTFVSTANAFVRQGARIVFVDSRGDHPGMDEASLSKLITPKTKAIVPVHYAGVACDMDQIMDLARKHDLIVIEDAAQAIDSFYLSQDGERKALGGIGHMAAFSFHETKNLICGEGGMLVVNDPRFLDRSEIIWEKGTNRASFFRGEVNKYGWVDVGSSFLPSEVTSAFLFAQLENLEQIQAKRKATWQVYHNAFDSILDRVKLPFIPDFAEYNGHLFYLVMENEEIRDSLIAHLKGHGILAVFHYLSLHKSQFYKDHFGDEPELKNCEAYSSTLLRLPLYYDLTKEDQDEVIGAILQFYESN